MKKLLSLFIVSILFIGCDTSKQTGTIMTKSYMGNGMCKYEYQYVGWVTTFDSCNKYNVGDVIPFNK